MKSLEKYGKGVLIFLIIVLWFIPLYQQLVPFLKVEPLQGDIRPEADSTLKKSNWFNGSYAAQKGKYLNENFGFRNLFVRIKNQVYFSLLKIPTARDVIIGKNNFLYEEKYIRAYTGHDFRGEAAILSRLQKVKFLTDTLEKLNIRLVLLFAPGKTTFYPEYIPDKYFSDCDTMNTNYKWTVRIAKQLNLNLIDYNALFKLQKKNALYPLYPKTGTHWSVYSMYMACDTLVKYLEHLTRKEFLHFKYDNVELSYNLRWPDGDIANGLNTLYEVKPLKMAYPDIHYVNNENAFKPGILTIADSYWMGIYSTLMPQHLFNRHRFWYYYQQNLDYSGNIQDPIDFKLKREIEKSDVILIMASEATIGELGWGFIEDAYDLYANGENSLRVHRKRTIANRIKVNMRADKKWLYDIENKAKFFKMTVDSMMNMDIQLMMNNRPDLYKLEKKSDIESDEDKLEDPKAEK